MDTSALLEQIRGLSLAIQERDDRLVHMERRLHEYEAKLHRCEAELEHYRGLGLQPPPSPQQQQRQQLQQQQQQQQQSNNGGGASYAPQVPQSRHSYHGGGYNAPLPYYYTQQPGMIPTQSSMPQLNPQASMPYPSLHIAHATKQEPAIPKGPHRATSLVPTSLSVSQNIKICFIYLHMWKYSYV
mgnify:CR=1 FL=1